MPRAVRLQRKGKMMISERVNKLFIKHQKKWDIIATTYGRHDLALDSIQDAWIDLDRWGKVFSDDTPDRVIKAYIAKAVERRARRDSVKESTRLDSEGLYVQSMDFESGDVEEETERPELGVDSMVRTIDDRLDMEKAVHVGAITEREYDVFYAIVVDRMTQREAAERLGVTQGRVSQILKAAQEKLYRFMNGEVPV